MRVGSAVPLRCGSGWLAVLALVLTSCGRVEREREAAAEAARVATVSEIERALSHALGLADEEAGEG